MTSPDDTSYFKYRVMWTNGEKTDVIVSTHTRENAERELARLQQEIARQAVYDGYDVSSTRAWIDED